MFNTRLERALNSMVHVPNLSQFHLSCPHRANKRNPPSGMPKLQAPNDAKYSEYHHAVSSATLQDTANYAHHANATFFFDLVAFDPADANVFTESSSSPPLFLFLFFLNESFASSNFDFFSCSFFSASSLRDSLISSICLALIIFDSISPFFSA